MTKKKPVRDPENIILDDYEKTIDEATNDPNMRISSGPEFEAWKKMMQVVAKNTTTNKTETVQIPVSIFEKFKKTMHEANIPYSVL